MSFAYDFGRAFGRLFSSNKPRNVPEPPPRSIGQNIQTMVVGADQLIGKQLAFTYEDANGNITQRVLTLWRADTNDYGEDYFYGMCNLRKEPRTFLLSRVQGTFMVVKDPETGEM